MSTKHMEESERLLLRARTVAQKLDISPAMAYKLIETGVLKSVRIGASIRVPAESLREYVQGLEVR